MSATYESPKIERLGSVRELTMAPPHHPPGKQGSAHDSSQFVQNFSIAN